MQIFPSCIANLSWKTYKLGSRFFWTHPQILTCHSHTTPRAPDTQTMHRRSASRDHVTCPAGNPCQSCMLVRIPCSVVMMDSTVENCRNIPFDVYHNSPLHVPHLQYTPEVTPPIVCAFNCTANNEKQVSGHPGAKTSTFLHGSYIDMADRFIRI